MRTDIYVDLAESSPNATFIFDLNTRQFIYVNRAFRTMLNVFQEPIEVKHLLPSISTEDQEYVIIALNHLLAGTLEKPVEFRLTPPDRKERWVRLSPLLGGRGRHQQLIFGNAVDITAEITNIDTYKKYANKKNSILNILAHDLMGPLGVARSISSLLNNKVEDPKVKELIETITKVNSQAINLIRDLTDREFLETAEIVLVKKRINVAVMLKDVIQEYQNGAELTKRHFTLSSSAPDIFIDLDESKFMQVINNLMTNALKFTKDYDSISIKIDEQADSVLFSVSDNGIGIPEQFHPTLFEKFTNARRKGLHGEPTIGLGMSIIKTIIEWHNGRVWFESKENEGTTVYFELPKINPDN